MEHKRLTLDNPVFAGTLRYDHRSVAYERRPLQPATINDILVVRKPKPKHAVTAAKSLHSPRPKPAVAGLRPVHKPVPINPKRHYLTDRHSMVLYGMAGVVFIVGLFVAINGMRANRQVAAQVQHVQKVSESTAGQPDNTAAVPSVAKPAPKTVTAYTVAPNLPKYIDIPKLRIHARVLSEGVDKKGALNVPWNIYDTGWYNSSAQPGQAGGMLIDGHSGIGSLHGVFHDLPKLVAGDSIVITRGDNTQFTYTVVKVQVVSVQNVDMSSMVVSDDPAKPGLNLITCAGDQIPGTDELNARTMVYAVMQ